MTRHLLIPGIVLDMGACNPAYSEYLKSWREEVIARADEGDIAASECLQATFADLVLFGAPKHDWLGIMEEHLSVDGVPLAYSTAFGRRLFKFDAQYAQTTIHAIHTRWWIEQLCTPDKVKSEVFASLILAKEQTDGLIYDLDVSPTILRHRMKSELTLSAAMSAEVLLAANKLTNDLSLKLATSLVDPKRVPSLGYIGTEYFRLRALEFFGKRELFPVGVAEAIASVSDGLEVGWCDFSMSSKVDAYMGTAKRTRRDKPIHSPLTALHVKKLSETIESNEVKKSIEDRFIAYGKHLKNNPLDIPAFQMRDVPIPFGADKSPIETISASSVIRSYEGQ